jgi:hypothetical protein
MAIEWYRVYHGTPYDPKLAVIASRANARRCEVLAVWVCMFDRASQNENRGSLVGFDPELVSVSQDIDIETVTRIVDALRQRGMISEDESLKNWCKRQFTKDDPTATERNRRHRERHGVITDEADDVTVPLRDVTPENGELRSVTPSDNRVQSTDTDLGSSSNTNNPQNLFEMPRSADRDGGEPAKPADTKASQKAKIDALFTEFWSHVWLKKAKDDARKAFPKALIAICKRDGCTGEVATGTLSNYAEREKDNALVDESRAKLHPATWLNGSRWDDEIRGDPVRRPAADKQSIFDKIINERGVA